MSDLKHRPYEVRTEVWDRCMEKFPKWLTERGGIVVFENHMLDSSKLGDRTYVPARYEDESGSMVDAPKDFWNSWGLASTIQSRIDHITLEEFGGDVEKCIAACFKKEEDKGRDVSFDEVRKKYREAGKGPVRLILQALGMKDLRKLAKEADVRGLKREDSIIGALLERAKEWKEP